MNNDDRQIGPAFSPEAMPQIPPYRTYKVVVYDIAADAFVTETWYGHSSILSTTGEAVQIKELIVDVTGPRERIVQTITSFARYWEELPANCLTAEMANASIIV